MSRLATRLTGPLLLLLLAVGPAWPEAPMPNEAPEPSPAAEATVATVAPADPVPAKEVEPQTTGISVTPPSVPQPTVNQVFRSRFQARASRERRSASLRLAQAPAEGSAEAQEPAAPAPATEPPKLDVSGFVDFYYEYNFNRPPRFVDDGAGNRVPNFPQNNLRNFDFKHNEFALNLAEVVVQRAPAPVGFRIDLDFGRATEWVHSTEPGGVENYKHIQQAYLTAPLRFWGKDDALDVGKFVTHHGAEVIETKDNWNYTRGLLFAWAIPYYHMGLRYKHPLSASSGLMFHLYNGWNNVEDNNNSLSYGLQYYGTLGKKLTLLQNYTGGPELTDDNHNWRHLSDTLLTYNASDKMAYMLNFDYLTEDRDNGSIDWIGLAAYARRVLSDRHALVLRGEWFKDSDGASTGVEQEVKEVTLTYEIKGPGGLLTRAELRHDWSNKDVFDDSDGGQKDTQTTLLLGAVYSF